MTKHTLSPEEVAEQDAWMDAGGGQPPSRDPAGAISKVFFIMGAALVLAFIIAMLVACSTPAVRDRIVEVDKPVAVQPIKPADVPKVPAPLGPRPRSLSAAADTLLSKVCEWVAYGLRADPLLKVSAGQAQKPLERYPECER